MLRRIQASFVLLCLASVPALAQEPANEAEPPSPAPTAEQPAIPPPAPQESKSSAPPADPGGWHMELSGYFRTPMAIGISSRQAPDSLDATTQKLTGPSNLQASYGPNRTVDANYFSFAYTRLQEQDWAEFFIHAKKKHVDAALGWMGYWYQAVGFRNPDSGWGPGLAYISLDTDTEILGRQTNIRGTAGAWWPSFGYMEVYDTYTLGRFRQLGAQLQWTTHYDSDSYAVLTGGFGTARDGSFNYGAPPFFGGIVGLDLLTYWNLEVKFNNYFDIAFHYNTEWTADPNLTQGSIPDLKSYGQLQAAHLTVVGAQATVKVPRYGQLWISPSIISIRNGWALNSAGTEVMHSLGGMGVATNYLAWTGSPADSTGSGKMINLGVVYENSFRSAFDWDPGSLPDLKLTVFGLMAHASIDFPSTTSLTQKNINQLKWGAAATGQLTTWFGAMLRADFVNYDQDNPGFVFASVTPRIYVQSHYLSSERIYLQYSRYFYGDKFVLNAIWPWGQNLVNGSSVVQQGPYSGKTPDENVVKLQADIAF
jgi:hypothetical protein